jgi:hypothetical protein
MNLSLMGWKTITAGVLCGAGYILPAVCPDQALAGAVLVGVGTSLGGLGVAHKVAKVLAALGQGAAQASAQPQADPSQTPAAGAQ